MKQFVIFLVISTVGQALMGDVELWRRIVAAQVLMFSGMYWARVCYAKTIREVFR